MNTPPIQQTSLVSELPTAQKKRLELWAERAISEHWLSENTLEQLSASVNATPGQLFEQSSHRPLVTGLFGGTGVGKSTLLNRLAGEPIARASAERPTSRDITIYVHRSVSVDHLPDNLPMQRMRTALHNNDDYQHVMFVDMPDFDSVEQSNRDLVNLWLPHLDVVMYVVSPERYRDDQGWRLLREHAAAHAWLFIINQWDRGDPLVRDDFIDQLAAQGLSAPMVFTTDCANPDHAPESNPALATDDFNALQETLLTLSDEQIISALQEHGVVARLQTLKSLSDSWIDGLGSTPSFDSLQQSWLQACEQEHDKTRSTTQLSIFQIAAQFADNTPFWKRLFGLVKPGSPDKPNALIPLTETLNERLLSALERFCNQQAHACGVSVAAIRKTVLPPFQESLAASRQTLDNALKRALHQPGTRWQRLLQKMTNLMSIGLPMLALAWISVRIVGAFIQGSSNPDAYLGSRFAVNSAMLLGVSWLIPALANTLFSPSLEQAAKQGLAQGVEEVIANTRDQAASAFIDLADQAAMLRADYQQLWAELPAHNDSELPAQVQRMLTDQITPEAPRRLDVRANVQSSTDAAPQS